MTGKYAGLLVIVAVLGAAQVCGQAYTFVGDSYSTGNNCYVLTPNSPWQNGSIWYNEMINLQDAFHLQVEINFGSNPDGADGMVFVMQQVGNSVIGLDGEGMGFSGFAPSLGVEFDTYQNTNLNDPVSDHMAILTNGNVNHSLGANLAGPVNISAVNNNVEDGMNHIVDIFWTPAQQVFEVWVDCVPRLSHNVDLTSTVFNNNPMVYWGFTGATGGLTNLQVVCLDPFILGLPESFEGCAGEAVQLLAPGISQGGYAWEPAQFLDDPTSQTPVAIVPSSTTFTLTYSDLCGTTQTESTDVVISEPTVDLGSDLSLCAGESVQISAQGNFDTIQWSHGPVIAEVEVSNSGTYSAEVWLNGCSSSDEVEVTETDLPILPTWVSAAEICDGASFTADYSAYNYTFLWSTGSTEPTEVFSEAGVYNLTISNGPCETPYGLQLTVNPMPVLPLSTSVVLCDGETATLQGAAPPAVTVWNGTVTAATLTVSSAGTYTAHAVLDGCEAWAVVDVLSGVAPDLFITGDDSFCQGKAATLTAVSDHPVTWNTGQTDHEINVAFPGIYTATATSVDGCETSDSFGVSRLDLPYIVAPASLSICEDSTAEVKVSSSNDPMLQWSTGTTGPVLLATEPGLYTVSLSNTCGDAESTVDVAIKDCSEHLFIPNAFTPNGDGVNDLFRPQGQGVEVFEMTIYNRQGERVFHSNAFTEAWNGSHSGSGYFCEPGVYVYHFRVKFEGPEFTEGNGHIVLLR